MLAGIEIMPQNTVQVAFTSSMILLGAMISAYMFGQMVVLVSNLNKDSNAFNELMTIANTAMNNMGIDPKLQFKIIDYLIATHENASNQHQYEKFRANIPPSIVKQVNASIYADIIADTPVFCSDTKATNEILKHIENSFYKPEEVVITQGDEANYLLFLVSGLLEVEIEPIGGEVYTIRIINPKEYFGEVGVLFDTPRTASVKVSKYANVGYVHKSILFDILQKFPKTLELLKSTAVDAYRNDPNKQYFFKTLRKLPYFNDISPSLFCKIMYQLKAEYYEEKDTIYSEGDEVRKIIFLYKGEIQMKMLIYDVDVKKTVKLSSKQQAVHESDSSFSRSFTRNPSQNNRHAKNRDAVEQTWCTLGPGSIIGWRQALFNRKTDVSFECSKQCTVFVLRTEDIDKIAEECHPLKRQLDMFTKRYIEPIGETKDVLIKTPVLDCHKSDEDLHNFESIAQNSVVKFKSSVLSFVLRRREARDREIVGIKIVVKKLKAIAQAENRKLKDVARKIERGELDPDIMENIDFLKQEDLDEPILQQFAKTTKEVKELHMKIVEQSNHLEMMSKEVKNEDTMIAEQIDFIAKAIEKL